MALSKTLLAVDATEPVDTQINSELVPHTLSDSAEFYYYLLGYDDQDAYLAENAYQILADRWRYVVVDNAMVNSVSFLYDKPAFGYSVPAVSCIVKINGVSSRLNLPATTTRAQFIRNCDDLVAWCAERSYDGKPRFVGHGAWGRTGVHAIILAPRIGDSFLTRGSATSRVTTSFYAGLVIRNAFGPKVMWQRRDLPVNQQVVMTGESELEAEAEGHRIEGESQPIYAPTVEFLVDRSSKVYQYLKTTRYGGGGNNEPGQNPDDGGGLGNGPNDMPWLSILMALITFFTSKRSGASNTKAALLAGLAGAGTYYVSHETDWGKANLGPLDGVVLPGTEIAVGADGQPLKDANGSNVLVGSNPNGTGTVTDVLKSWGATGTATVIGTTAAATGSGLFSSKNAPWLIAGAVALIVILKD